MRNFIFALALLLAAIAIPPPLVAPPLASGRLEDMSAVLTNGLMTEKQYGITYLKYATSPGDFNVLRRDAIFDTQLPAPPNGTPLLNIAYQLNKNNQTRSWNALFYPNSTWTCEQVQFPFPDQNFLANDCDQGAEDILGTVETWKYRCNITGLSTDVWILQNPNVAIQIENVVGAFGIFGATTTWYLDFAPLAPNTTARSLLPPTVAGCNITGV
jgi:hypothetical protein